MAIRFDPPFDSHHFRVREQFIPPPQVEFGLLALRWKLDHQLRHQMTVLTASTHCQDWPSPLFNTEFLFPIHSASDLRLNLSHRLQPRAPSFSLLCPALSHERTYAGGSPSHSTFHAQVLEI